MEEFKIFDTEESIDAIMDNVATLRTIENDLRQVLLKMDI